MQKFYKDIQAENAELIVISSDDQGKNKLTVQRTKAEYPLLSDTKKESITAYNATDPLNPKIARPQTYIIDLNGTIRWKFLDVRVGQRLNPATVVNELKKL